MKRAFLTIIVFLVSAVLVACASTPARNPVPAELTSQVGIEGIPEALEMSRRYAMKLKTKL